MLFSFKKDIPIDNRYDVIVVGGGPAGVAAATAASRENAHTLLIEATGCLGGMGTAGLVPAWCPFTDGKKIVYNGIAKKVFYANKERMKHVALDDLNGWQPLDPEFLKRYYDVLVSEYGASVLFHTQLCGVEMLDGGVIDKLIISNKNGLSALQAKIYIDCTGDGDLAYWAGAQTITGNEDGNVQPGTLCFVLSNVDSYAFLSDKADKNNIKTGNWVYEGSPAFSLADNTAFPNIPDSHLCGNLIGPATVGFNAGHIFDVDSTNPSNVSHNMMVGRKLANSIQEALAQLEPKSFSNAYLASTAMLMGIRESRRVIGTYVLTVDDYLARRDF
ncbi:MAG: FAD-dependent oxidoreductase, partial [Ruthenibacterium sp.]